MSWMGQDFGGGYMPELRHVDDVPGEDGLDEVGGADDVDGADEATSFGVEAVDGAGGADDITRALGTTGQGGAKKAKAALFGQMSQLFQKPVGSLQDIAAQTTDTVQFGSRAKAEQ